ncbi:FecR domain-containing protein [Variovorax sp. PCZ-1]|uniref:FecR family protein n=1 Tax=Variovorax sp. PCZ-1 TaxID=2835533 RepID=UPI001BCDB679|nr:FecR domain-containing protein [Variovorax sp. PCZ-1]MBS7808020.1 FecR domain-containing protein [Variovorax sp. PCZ-1]
MAFFSLAVVCSALSWSAFAQTTVTPANRTSNAGEVEFMRGVGFAQTPGQTPRTLGKGLPLQEGDRLTTADGATAVVKLQDGTRMTVRPGSEMVLSQFKFSQDAQDNSMVINMLRGGLRAITGLIAKGSPNAARIQTNTATIGIRGTDFDARICSVDCGNEGRRIAQNAKPNAIQASAKVLSSRGEVLAVDGAGQRRRLVDGGGLYPGDVVETGQGTQAVLAFRDESRVTVGATTRFRIDNFVFDSKNAGEGRMLTSILKGTVRALSGLIGKANNKNVSYSTSTATIGIRGTEVLIRCVGVCAGEGGGQGDGLTVFTYSGQVDVTKLTDFTSSFVLTPGRGLSVTPAGTQEFGAEPPNDLTAPGSLPLPASLFGSDNVNENQEGLYVFVRDGHIELTTNSSVLHLGRNEAGLAGNDGSTVRPQDVPRFLEFDRTPLPNSTNFNVAALLGDSNITGGRVCR